MPQTTRDTISLPCDIETRRPTIARQRAWHQDCPYPESCACPAHDRDDQWRQDFPRWKVTRTARGYHASLRLVGFTSELTAATADDLRAKMATVEADLPA